MATRKYSQDELAKLGIQVEPPKIDVQDTDPELDTINSTDLSSLAANEAFMHEHVTIRLATTTDQNAPPYASITVNDVNNRVVIPRGQPFRVKRLHVEVLARMRETRYTQATRNPMDPESGNRLIAHHAMVYPFEVIEDKNPRGRAWLEALMAEPAY